MNYSDLLHQRYITGMIAFAFGSSVSVLELFKNGGILLVFGSAVVGAAGAYYGMRAKRMEVKLRELDLTIKMMELKRLQEDQARNPELNLQDSSSLSAPS